MNDYEALAQIEVLRIRRQKEVLEQENLQLKHELEKERLEHRQLRQSYELTLAQYEARRDAQ